MIIEYSIDEETGEFKLISSSLKNQEQKGIMDDERMKHYEGREKLSDYKIEMDVDSDDN